MRRKLNVLVLFDYPMEPPDKHYARHLVADDWKTEKAVFAALKQLGHDAKPFPIFNRISPLVAELRRRPPDVVVNLADSFANKREHDADLAGLLELCRARYTGCPPVALTVCRNKAFTKRILTPLRVKVPKSVIFPRGQLNRSLKNLKYPLFVKPLGQEGSDGVSQNSFAENAQACLERVKFLHESLSTDAFVEEYIEGREIYAGMLGNKRMKILPLREMVFSKVPDEKPKFASFKSKWDDTYRKKWGIHNTYAENVNAAALKRIKHVAHVAWKALGLWGYGRLDIRLTPDNEVYVIEVNPNPSLAPDDEICLGCKKLGWDYPKMLQNILDLALQGHPPA